MKRLIAVFILSAAAVCFLAGSAAACPYMPPSPYMLPSLYQVTGWEGTQGIYDSGAEYAWWPSSAISNFTLQIEWAGYAPNNSFGIYGFSCSPWCGLDLGETLELFTGSDSPITTVQLIFDFFTGTVTIAGTGTSASIGPAFGFYITTEPGYTYYSHTCLNPDYFNHMLVFNTPSLPDMDLVIAIEDLWGGGDRDYNDMVVSLNYISDSRLPGEVPLPGAVWLLGWGLIGLAGYRKKFKN